MKLALDVGIINCEERTTLLSPIEQTCKSMTTREKKQDDAKKEINSIIHVRPEQCHYPSTPFGSR